MNYNEENAKGIYGKKHIFENQENTRIRNIQSTNFDRCEKLYSMSVQHTNDWRCAVYYAITTDSKNHADVARLISVV